MKAKTSLAFAGVLLVSMAAASPAGAVTAGDVMDKMESDERHGFIGGAIDMASHLYAADGNLEKARCATDWFFRSGDDPLREVYAFFDAHKDKDAVAILSVLINRHCDQ